VAVVVCALTLLQGCAMLKRKAVGMVAETLASSGDVFTRDDDLELVGDAIPFGLKLYESLLDSAPTNKDLLIATCSNFTQYGVAYLETDALVLGDAQHHDEVVRLNARALKLYLRARGYCERAMEVRFPGIMQKLPADPVGALAKAEKKDVPLLYWMAASWGSAIALGVDRPDAASANSTGPLLVAGAALGTCRGALAPPPRRTSRPRWSAGPYGSSGRRAAGSFESRDTLNRPDDARKNSLLSASARSTLGVNSRAGLSQTPRVA